MTPKETYEAILQDLVNSSDRYPLIPIYGRNSELLIQTGNLT